MNFFSSNFHRINIPPLLLIVFCFIIGISNHSLLLLFCAIFCLSLCCVFFAYIKQMQLPQQLILCSFFTLFGAWLHNKELQDYHNFYSFADNKKITVTGMVIDKNIATVNHQKTTVITLAIDTIATDIGTQKSNKVLLFYTKSNNGFVVGDTVTIFDVCCKKPSGEDFQHYQIKEQVLATLFCNDIHFHIDLHPRWSLRNWIWHEKKRLLDALAHKLSPNGFRFFSSLFLGNRACIKNELEATNEQFKTWGISHFLARSGLHLALFIFIWQAIFCVIPLPLIVKQIIISLLSCIYFILTWTSAPFTRSFALFVVNKICFFKKTSFHLLHYLTLVCFGFLLYCPLYLFFLDFQLTFALTFALAWFNQVSVQHKAQ
jgi:predicted membrane metal-binding protein